MNQHTRECLKSFVFWAAITFILGMAYQYGQGRTVLNRAPQSASEEVELQAVFDSILDDLGLNFETSQERYARQEKELKADFNSTDEVDISWAIDLDLEDL